MTASRYKCKTRRQRTSRWNRCGNVYTTITMRPIYCLIKCNCFPSYPVISYSIIHKVGPYRQNMCLFPAMNCNVNSIMMMMMMMIIIKKTIAFKFQRTCYKSWDITERPAFLTLLTVLCCKYLPLLDGYFSKFVIHSYQSSVTLWVTCFCFEFLGSLQRNSKLIRFQTPAVILI